MVAEGTGDAVQQVIYLSPTLPTYGCSNVNEMPELDVARQPFTIKEWSLTDVSNYYVSPDISAWLKLSQWVTYPNEYQANVSLIISWEDESSTVDEYSLRNLFIVINYVHRPESKKYYFCVWCVCFAYKKITSVK